MRSMAQRQKPNKSARKQAAVPSPVTDAGEEGAEPGNSSASRAPETVASGSDSAKAAKSVESAPTAPRGGRERLTRPDSRPQRTDNEALYDVAAQAESEELVERVTGSLMRREQVKRWRKFQKRLLVLLAVAIAVAACVWAAQKYAEPIRKSNAIQWLRDKLGTQTDGVPSQPIQESPSLDDLPPELRQAIQEGEAEGDSP